MSQGGLKKVSLSMMEVPGIKLRYIRDSMGKETDIWYTIILPCNAKFCNTTVFRCLKTSYIQSQCGEERGKQNINKVKLLYVLNWIKNYIPNVLQSFISIGPAGLYRNLQRPCS